MRQMWKAVAMLGLVVGATNVPVAQSRQIAPDVPPEFQFLRGSVEIGKLQKTWDALPLDSITLERTRCFGECPAYRVTFYKRTASVKDGGQTYQDQFGQAELVATVAGQSGPRFALFRRFPEATGTFTGWVNLFTVARLSLLIHTQGFSARPEGSLKGWSSDAPGTAVGVTGRLKRTVVGEWPMELWSIEQAIDSAAKDINWTRK